MNLLSLLPWWVKLAILAAIAAAIYFAWGYYVADPYREQGAAPVRAEFAAYKTAQDKQRSEIILDYVGKIARADEDKRQADATAGKRLAILDTQVGNVASTARGISLPADVVGVWNSSTSFANSRLAAPVGGKQPGTETVPEAAAGAYDERDLAQFFRDASEAYDDAVGLMVSCRAERTACRDARSKTLRGAP